MALPASLTARLGELLTESWSEIIADAAANNGKTNLSFSINIDDTPAGGPISYSIGYQHRFRTEVTQSKFETFTGTLS
jgi:hypothetical protein